MNQKVSIFIIIFVFIPLTQNCSARVDKLIITLAGIISARNELTFENIEDHTSLQECIKMAKEQYDFLNSSIQDSIIIFGKEYHKVDHRKSLSSFPSLISYSKQEPSKRIARIILRVKIA